MSTGSLLKPTHCSFLLCRVRKAVAESGLDLEFKKGPSDDLLRTTREGLFAGRLSDSREDVEVLDVAVVGKLRPVTNN